MWVAAAETRDHPEHPSPGPQPLRAGSRGGLSGVLPAPAGVSKGQAAQCTDGPRAAWRKVCAFFSSCPSGEGKDKREWVSQFTWVPRRPPEER